MAPLHRSLGRSPRVDPRGCLPIPERGDGSKSRDLGVQLLSGAQADVGARFGVRLLRYSVKELSFVHDDYLELLLPDPDHVSRHDCCSHNLYDGDAGDATH